MIALLKIRKIKGIIVFWSGGRGGLVAGRGKCLGGNCLYVA